ncbi:hypothetical protein SAMN05661008_01344 [Alkalithermobacter thermoalcaliphilus JW-YL-7 = DSM 7308]|uniref:Ribosomal processing cysteine protease Prp n=1 Tax=Alkalithermobacter thermoalcaliphilus JW-YL-7 = DSM 7308 TaxID=1121328 RepID=A0A150FRB5_CLOPD|nr:protein of unknown function DUF464 [[Clostridium] paradoxum JW-YL-7 = DSM 7308]SHL03162.1 hypothetical protein SAMN05661008_01344 [[Clostridium] paradoxum JW-YL-7 = DSM 7308]
MIKAVIRRDSKGQIFEFEIKGHANYAQHGEDIVCAAVSALSQTVIIGLCDYLNIKCDFKIDSGYLHCKLPFELDKQKRLQADAVLETMVLGIKNIKEGYPSFVKLYEKEV